MYYFTPWSMLQGDLFLVGLWLSDGKMIYTKNTLLYFLICVIFCYIKLCKVHKRRKNLIFVLRFDF